MRFLVLVKYVFYMFKEWFVDFWYEVWMCFSIQFFDKCFFQYDCGKF